MELNGRDAQGEVAMLKGESLLECRPMQVYGAQLEWIAINTFE